MVSSLNLLSTARRIVAAPAALLSFGYPPGCPSGMFSFDGFRFGYLIGRASADGTTKLSKPEVKLLSRAATTEPKLSAREPSGLLLCRP